MLTRLDASRRARSPRLRGTNFSILLLLLLPPSSFSARSPIRRCPCSCSWHLEALQIRKIDRMTLAGAHRTAQLCLREELLMNRDTKAGKAGTFPVIMQILSTRHCPRYAPTVSFIKNGFARAAMGGANPSLMKETVRPAAHCSPWFWGFIQSSTEWLPNNRKWNNGTNGLCRIVRPIQPIIPFPALSLLQPLCKYDMYRTLSFRNGQNYLPPFYLPLLRNSTCQHCPP